MNFRLLGFLLIAVAGTILSLAFAEKWIFLPVIVLGLVFVVSFAFKNHKLSSLLALPFVLLLIENGAGSVLLSNRLSIVTLGFFLLAVGKKETFYFRVAAVFSFLLIYLLFLDVGAVSSLKLVLLIFVAIGALFSTPSKVIDRIFFISMFVVSYMVIISNLVQTAVGLTYGFLALILFFFVTSRVKLPFSHGPSYLLQATIRDVSKLGAVATIAVHAFVQIYPVLYQTNPQPILALIYFTVLQFALLFPKAWTSSLFGQAQAVLNGVVLLIIPFSFLNYGLISLSFAVAVSGSLLFFRSDIQKRIGCKL
jgi:hypothetical protein